MTPRLVLAILVAAASAWFLISWKLMQTAPGDAASESVGASLGVLVLISVIGALRGKR